MKDNIRCFYNLLELILAQAQVFTRNVTENGNNFLKHLRLLIANTAKNLKNTKKF